MARNIDDELMAAEARVAELKKQKQDQLAKEREQQIQVLGELVLGQIQAGELPDAVTAWIQTKLTVLSKKKRAALGDLFPETKQATPQTMTTAMAAAE